MCDLPKPVILDMDPGVDDALALLLASRSRLLDIKAITLVSGNITLEKCIQNTLKILNIVDSDLEAKPIIAAGAHRPLHQEPLFATSVHGSDGLGEINRCLNSDGSAVYPEIQSPISEVHAKDVILGIISNSARKPTLIATGPLTNIALAILDDSKAMRKVEGLIIMGGAFRVPGNITPVAEFNACADPDAMKIVLDSGIFPITILGLDVTHRVRLMREAVSRASLEHSSKVARFIRDCTRIYMDFYKSREGFDGCYLHDPLAVGAAIWPDLIETRPMRVHIETNSSLTRGLTFADFRPWEGMNDQPNADVALDVDAERFLRHFYEFVLMS